VISKILVKKIELGPRQMTFTVLTKFYNQRLPFWQEFIDQMQAFKTNLKTIKNNKQIFLKHQRLSEIIKSSYPYPQLIEAERLLTDVQVFHQQVEREKIKILRSNAMGHGENREND